MHGREPDLWEDAFQQVIDQNNHNHSIVNDNGREATEQAPAGTNAPRGVPGLPSRPRGGLPSLPARPAGPIRPGGNSQRQQQNQREGGEEESEQRASAQPAQAPAPAPRPVARTEPPSRPEEPASVQNIRKKVQTYRTNIFRAALRLRYPIQSAMVQQLMYRLGMAERLHLQSASTAIPQQELDGIAQANAERAEVLAEPFDFSCTVLVLGMAGVGKTAAVHSLLGIEPLSGYHPTDSVQVLRGQVAGVPITFIDTPGLQPGPASAAANLKTLHAAKRAWNKHRPHVVLYVDRMDVPRRDQADLPVMRAIADVFGDDIWFSTILTLTHATSPLPDGPNGHPITLEAFQQQRSAQIQQSARQVTRDQRLMNPVAYVESSPSCPATEDGEPVLPNGTPWRRQLLMLCFTTQVLNEANTILKPGGDSAARMAKNPMAQYMGMKIPPLGWLLSRLIEFRGPRKPPEDEREIKYDDEINAMPPTEKSAALRKKRMFLKAKAEEARAMAGDSVPIPAPEPQLGPSFDADISSHHYKVLEDPTKVLIRPIVADSGIDRADGVDTIHIEKQTVLRRKGKYLGGFPVLAYCQVTKDKQQFAYQSQIDSAYHFSSKLAASAELNMQTIGRDVLYTQRLESRLRTGRRNKITAGVIASKLGEDYSHPFGPGALAYGAKIDDRIKITPNAKVRASVGRVYTKAGTALDHGTAASAELKMKPGGDPTTQVLVGGSAVWQRRDTTIAGSMAGEYRLPKMGKTTSGFGGVVGKSDTIVSANASYNNKGNGQVVCRINSHDYPQLALTMVVPILRTVWDRLRSREDF